MLTTQLRKWGNGYGICIPKTILDQMALDTHTQFAVRLENRTIVLIPIPSRPILDDLLAQVTDENLNRVSDTWPDPSTEAG